MVFLLFLVEPWVGDMSRYRENAQNRTFAELKTSINARRSHDFGADVGILLLSQVVHRIQIVGLVVLIAIGFWMLRLSWN